MWRHIRVVLFGGHCQPSILIIAGRGQYFPVCCCLDCSLLFKWNFIFLTEIHIYVRHQTKIGSSDFVRADFSCWRWNPQSPVRWQERCLELPVSSDESVSFTGKPANELVNKACIKQEISLFSFQAAENVADDVTRVLRFWNLCNLKESNWSRVRTTWGRLNIAMLATTWRPLTSSRVTRRKTIDYVGVGV